MCGRMLRSRRVLRTRGRSGGRARRWGWGTLSPKVIWMFSRCDTKPSEMRNYLHFLSDCAKLLEKKAYEWVLF